MMTRLLMAQARPYLAPCIFSGCVQMGLLAVRSFLLSALGHSLYISTSSFLSASLRNLYTVEYIEIMER